MSTISFFYTNHTSVLFSKWKWKISESISLSPPLLLRSSNETAVAMAALASSLSSLHLSAVSLSIKAKARPNKQNFKQIHRRSLRVTAATEGSAKNPSNSKQKDDPSGGDPSAPSWAQPGSDELPPWARQEAQKETSGFEVPFYVYLVASSITAIAAIGSIFEYVNQKPVFGVLSSDSIFYAPVLGFFAFTGIPSSAFLWYKSVQVANKEAEEQDRKDGYL